MRRRSYLMTRLAAVWRLGMCEIDPTPSLVIGNLGLTLKFGYFDLQLHIGFAVLVPWCPVKLLENPKSWHQKLTQARINIWTRARRSTGIPVSRRTRVESFGPISRHSKRIVRGVIGSWCERRFWNSHFPHFGEIDQIWRGLKIGSFDPVITNSSATDSRWPQLYICKHSNATYPLHKACSERTSLFYGQTNMKWKRTYENIYGYLVLWHILT
jgi:hypothetical protein